jgi:hypothetical protein
MEVETKCDFMSPERCQTLTYTCENYLIGANALFGERFFEIEPYILVVARAVNLQRVLDDVVESKDETECGEALTERNRLVNNRLRWGWEG